jgi:hypothetical protein
MKSKDFVVVIVRHPEREHSIEEKTALLTERGKASVKEFSSLVLPFMIGRQR